MWITVCLAFLVTNSQVIRAQVCASETSYLSRLKVKEVARLSAIVRASRPGDAVRVQAVRRLGALQTRDATEVLHVLYRAAQTEAPLQRRVLAEALVDSNREEAKAALVMAAFDSEGGYDHRIIAAQGLRRLMGQNAIPLLRRLQEDDEEQVRRAARHELVILGDRQAIDVCLRQLNAIDQSVVAVALDTLAAAREEFARDAVVRLFHELATDHGKDAPGLRLRAGVTALELGDESVMPGLIKMVGVDPKALRGSGMGHPADFLARYTGQNFGRKEDAWMQWWEATGKHTAVYLSSSDADARLAIVQAVIDWGQSPTVRYVKEFVVYVERRYDEQSFCSLNLRRYTPAELELLQRPGYQVVRIRSNGDSATAILRARGMSRGAGEYSLQLKSSDRGWRVIEAKHRTPRW